MLACCLLADLLAAYCCDFILCYLGFWGDFFIIDLKNCGLMDQVDDVEGSIFKFKQVINNYKS